MGVATASVGSELKGLGRGKQVTIFKEGHMLRIKPASRVVVRVLREALTYQRIKYLATAAERQEAGSHIQIDQIECFEIRTFKTGKQVVTNTGYLTRIQKVLKRVGYKVRLRDKNPPKPEGVYKPRLERLKDIEFRADIQRETLLAMVHAERGQVHWATGTGKGWLLPHFCDLLPKAKIVITTKHIDVLEMLYSRLRARLPSVGIYHSKKKKPGRRVMCYSSGSLDHALAEKPDILLADEVHELATDYMFEKLCRFKCRMIGMSANFGDRMDGADFELEGCFGPLISELTYQDAEAAGLIVPLHVYWREINCPRNPAEGETGVEAARWGIWRNKWRNKQIADDANCFKKDQVLITVKTLEHACALKRHLPDFSLCYAPGRSNEEKLSTYKEMGWVPWGEPEMTPGYRKMLRRRFEQGKCKKVIATSVWNRGVDFTNLQVLIRADGSSSTIDDTQIPGRLSRTAAGKDCGIMLDYLDEFDDDAARKAKKRRRDYGARGWTQHMPESEDGEPQMLRYMLTGRK